MLRRNGDLLDVLFLVLLLIYRNPGISRNKLSKRLGVSDQVIGRQVKTLREKFKVEINSSPSQGYELAHWGIFDQGQFLEKIEAQLKSDQN